MLNQLVLLVSVIVTLILSLACPWREPDTADNADGASVLLEAEAHARRVALEGPLAGKFICSPIKRERSRG